MLIAIDHGNITCVLSSGKVFTSGLAESDIRPPFGADTIYFNGKYYALSEKRSPYLRDKTVDERFFVLTVFVKRKIQFRGTKKSSGGQRVKLG